MLSDVILSAALSLITVDAAVAGRVQSGPRAASLGPANGSTLSLSLFCRVAVAFRAFAFYCTLIASNDCTSRGYSFTQLLRPLAHILSCPSDCRASA